MSKFENDLTEGSVLRKLIWFAIPFFISNMIQSVYSVADMMIISFYGGTPSVAAVNMSSQVVIILTNFAAGISVGGTVTIGQHFGSKNMERIPKTISTLLITLFGTAAVLMAGMLIFLNPILDILNTPVEAYSESRDYLLVSIVGIAFIFGYNALSAIMRGLGDSKTPMYFVIIACIVNIGLDFLLMGYYSMGAMGAAIATVFSQGLSFVLCIIYLKRNNFIFDFRLKSFSFSGTEFRSLMITGLPSSLQHVATNLSFLVLTAIVNSIGGVAASAAVGIVGKFNAFAILPNVAVSNSASAMISQNMGAGKEKRSKSAVGYTLIICIIIDLIVMAAARNFTGEIFAMFNAEKDVIEQGFLYMNGFSFEYVFLPFIVSFNAVFIGSGNGWISMITNLLTAFIVRIPLAIILSQVFDMGIFGISCAVPSATFVASAVAFGFYLSGIWKKSRIK